MYGPLGCDAAIPGRSPSDTRILLRLNAEKKFLRAPLPLSHRNKHSDEIVSMIRHGQSLQCKLYSGLGLENCVEKPATNCRDKQSQTTMTAVCNF
jgi:hypothetical protein